MSLREVLVGAEQLLGAQGKPWCVVGGLAVAVHTPTRFTVDVDLAVGVDDDRDAEAISVAFLRAGFFLVAALEHETTGRLASVRLERGPGEALDLLFALTGIEPTIAAEAEALEILPGQTARTAAIGHLVAMKLLSVEPGRPRDEQDLVALLRRCDDAERPDAARLWIGGIAAATALGPPPPARRRSPPPWSTSPGPSPLAEDRPEAGALALAREQEG